MILSKVDGARRWAMRYRVLFESRLSQHPSREVVRLLESFQLRVISVEAADAIEGGLCPSVPLVTLGAPPVRPPSLLRLGPREWIALLPEGDGSTSPFIQAGAFAALRLPVERSVLLSTVSRCLCAAGATAAG